MNISFADSRPTGDFALVLPVAGKDRSALASLGAAQTASARRSTASASKAKRRAPSEHFIDDEGTVRRVLVVGTGTGKLSG